ncbi:MAG: hypothetical protein ACE5HL_01825 [Terriglobia bacterium]
MIPTRRWLPLALLAILVGGFALVRLQQGVDRTLADSRPDVQVLYLPSGEWVKRLSLGYDGLLACLYWTRAVQHYGRERLAKGQYPLLYPLLDITTTLDPELLLAYRFGAIFLTEEPPRGPGRPDQAIKLLRKGIEQNPDYWRFWYDLGFVYYRSVKDYQRAAQAFYQGAQHPKAAPWMAVMAAKIAAEGGNRRWGRFLWTELYNSADDPLIRQNALRHLRRLQVEEDMEILEALLRRYRQQTGQPAHSLRQLLAAGLVRTLPRDPAGYPYRLGPHGRVQLHAESPLTQSFGGQPK